MEAQEVNTRWQDTIAALPEERRRAGGHGFSADSANLDFSGVPSILREPFRF